MSTFSAMQQTRAELSTLQGERERLAADLASLQGALDVMRRKEAEMTRDFETRKGEHEDIGAELAELEAAAARKVSSA